MSVSVWSKTNQKANILAGIDREAINDLKEYVDEQIANIDSLAEEISNIDTIVNTDTLTSIDVTDSLVTGSFISVSNNKIGSSIVFSESAILGHYSYTVTKAGKYRISAPRYKYMISGIVTDSSDVVTQLLYTTYDGSDSTVYTEEYTFNANVGDKVYISYRPNYTSELSKYATLDESVTSLSNELTSTNETIENDKADLYGTQKTVISQAGNYIGSSKITLNSTCTYTDNKFTLTFDSATTEANYYILGTFTVDNDNTYTLKVWETNTDETDSGIRLGIYTTRYFTSYIVPIKANSTLTYSLVAGTKYYLSIRLPSGISGTVSVKATLSIGDMSEFSDDFTSTSKKISLISNDHLNAEIVKNGNVLYGKKWAVCGDSFSHGDFSSLSDTTDCYLTDGLYKGKAKIYGYLIGNRNNMDIQHLALGGRTMGLPSDGTFTNSFVNYYQTIDEDVDYITLYFGINDEHHASSDSSTDGEDVTGVIDIGTVDDTSTDTFCGAYNTVLAWLIENRPTAKIGIIVTNGITSTTDYRDKTIAIAKKYGLPYIDLNGDERTTSMHRTCNENISSTVKKLLLAKWEVSSTNTHPNVKAHEFESYMIENFLRSL